MTDYESIQLKERLDKLEDILARHRNDQLSVIDGIRQRFHEIEDKVKDLTTFADRELTQTGEVLIDFRDRIETLECKIEERMVVMTKEIEGREEMLLRLNDLETWMRACVNSSQEEWKEEQSVLKRLDALEGKKEGIPPSHSIQDAYQSRGLRDIRIGDPSIKEAFEFKKEEERLKKIMKEATDPPGEKSIIVCEKCPKSIDCKEKNNRTVGCSVYDEIKYKQERKALIEKREKEKTDSKAKDHPLCKCGHTFADHYDRDCNKCDCECYKRVDPPVGTVLSTAPYTVVSEIDGESEIDYCKRIKEEDEKEAASHLKIPDITEKEVQDEFNKMRGATAEPVPGQCDRCPFAIGGEGIDECGLKCKDLKGNWFYPNCLPLEKIIVIDRTKNNEESVMEHIDVIEKAVVADQLQKYVDACIDHKTLKGIISVYIEKLRKEIGGEK